jgi:hypothetical protein
MQGYVTRPDLYAADKWVGQRVNYNGTTVQGRVVQAFWGGYQRPVSLIVDWDTLDLPSGHSVPLTTDTEHVTVVRHP